MNEQQKSSCCKKQASGLELVKVDPVCGMNVSEDSAHSFTYQEKKYLFCCDGCKQNFVSDPEKYLAPDNKPVSGCGCASKAKVAEKTSSCCGSQKTQQPQYIDPVCGMTVTDLSKPHTEYSGQTYYFCCQGCLNKFQANPEQYLEKNKSKTSGCGCASKSKVEEKNSCCGGAEQTTKDVLTVTDLVCGMQVKTDSKFHRQYEEQDYYFCSESCLNKFNQQPEQYLQSNQKTSSCCG